MEYRQVGNLQFEISRVVLGTWALGGWQWGGTRQNQPVETILKALNQGVTTIDTAPVYGFGISEELVGKAVREYGRREDVIIATKLGLEWDEDENIRRNSSRDRILKEIEESLERLQTDYIDIYQVHWPDLDTDFTETAGTMKELYDKGVIRAIGVSNFTADQMRAFMETAPLHVSQPPYNLFEREAGEAIIPFCRENNITLMTYGALCRGLLSGKMDEDWHFEEGDIRQHDPKFKGEKFNRYLEAVERLQTYARTQFSKEVLHLAVRWILDMGVDAAIWGARRPAQVTFNEVIGWKLSDDDLRKIEEIVEESVHEELSPAFMAPPT